MQVLAVSQWESIYWDMESLISDVLHRNQIDITFVNVIKWTMHCIEMWSESVQTGKGASKLKLLREHIPSFINCALQLKLVSDEHAKEILDKLDGEWDLVTNIASALCEIAHNPDFVQFQERVARCCK